MFRRSGWFGLFLILVVATFLSEPRATARFAWDSSQAVGEFGGEVVSELNSDPDDEAAG